MSPFPVYGPEEVRGLLDYDGCIAAVRAAMARFTAEGTAQPLRSIVEIAPGKLFGLMRPGALRRGGAAQGPAGGRSGRVCPARYIR